VWSTIRQRCRRVSAFDHATLGGRAIGFARTTARPRLCRGVVNTLRPRRCRSIASHADRELLGKGFERGRKLERAPWVGEARPGSLKPFRRKLESNFDMFRARRQGQARSLHARA
jgi:hypothetical protein